MASNVTVLRQVVDLLMKRPEVRDRARRARSEGIGLSKKPNAPKIVTIIVAVLLSVVGLAVTGTVEIAFIDELLVENNLELTEEQGWLPLAASPLLLVLGSFFRGL